MQKFKDAFGIEVDDDDPWYKEHPGEYKVVGYTPIGEELYYRPGMNDDDDDDEGDRPAYTSHSSGGTYYETPQMRKARHKFYIKIALGIIAGLFALWVVIGFVSNITHTNHEKNTANESITTSLTQIDGMNNFAKTLLDNPALTAVIGFVSNITHTNHEKNTANESITTSLTQIDGMNNFAKTLLDNPALTALADSNTINGVADAQTAMNETANKAKAALNSDDHNTLTTDARKLRASIIALTRNLNMAYANIAANTANTANDATLKDALEQAKTTLDNQPIAAMYNNNRDYLTGLWKAIGDAVANTANDATLKDALEQAKTTLDNQPIAAMYNNNRDYLTGLWKAIGDAVTQNGDAASLANTINECTDHL